MALDTSKSHTFWCSGKIGDTVFGLNIIAACQPSILKLYMGGSEGQSLFTPESVEALMPLLQYQKYIRGVELTDRMCGPEECNLDCWRWKWQWNRNTCDMLADAFGLPHWPRDKPWIEVPKPIRVSHVIVARCSRYHNDLMDWRRIMWHYRQLKPTMIGLPEEFVDLQRWVGPLSYYHTEDFLEAAQVIAAADLCLMNQTGPHAIAESLKRPKVMEQDPANNNCHWQRMGAHYQLHGHEKLPAM